MDCTLYIVYKSSLLSASYAKRHPLCKHRKQFSACYMPFDRQNMVSRYNWPMAQTTACPSHSPTNDHLLWSEKMRFSNPCKYMLMGFQNLIFRFVYSGLSSCAPEKLNNSNTYFVDIVKRSLVPRLYVWNLNLLWDLTKFHSS